MVSQGSVLGLVPFNILINGINSRIKHTLSKLVDDNRLCGAVNMVKGWDVIQRRLDTLKQVYLIKYNESKFKVLHLGRGNIYYQYKLGHERIECSPAEKDAEVLMNGKLDMS